MDIDKRLNLACLLDNLLYSQNVELQHKPVADPAMGPRGPGPPPLFSYQNNNIHYCVHAFFREYH